MGIALTGEPVAVASSEESFIHPVRFPRVHIFRAPKGVIILVQQRTHFVPHIGGVGIFAYAEPCGVVADAAEVPLLLGGPSSRNVRNDVVGHEEGAVKVGKNPFDDAIGLVHVDNFPNEVIAIHGKFPRQRFIDEDVLLPDKIFRTSFYQMILREHLEEVGIGLHAGALEQLVTLADERLPQHGGTGCRLNLRDVHYHLLLIPIGEAQELIGSQHKCALPLRRLVRHLILLHHVAAYQDHKRQTHGQPHRLDSGV